ncbi:hypothetical protein M0R45_034902 [Rubus argutus]|uniref:Uncharacterized protein n=1 Tax=Rubus argutus TaxID=59490 RepID=A0AAW1VT75_RUBAR
MRRSLVAAMARETAAVEMELMAGSLEIDEGGCAAVASTGDDAEDESEQGWAQIKCAAAWRSTAAEETDERFQLSTGSTWAAAGARWRARALGGAVCGGAVRDGVATIVRRRGWA